MTLGEFLQVANDDIILTLNGNDYRYPAMSDEVIKMVFSESLLNSVITLIEIKEKAHRITLKKEKEPYGYKDEKQFDF